MNSSRRSSTVRPSGSSGGRPGLRQAVCGAHGFLAEFVSRYEAAGGRNVEPTTLRFHTVWNAVRLYGLIMQARAALAAGVVRDVEITYACADATMRLLRALGGELREERR